MSAELVLASGNNATPQETTIGGSKPLHRFIKRQPKIIGIVVLVLGCSSVIISFAIRQEVAFPIWMAIPLGVVLGVMLIISGILFIVTEHNPTKKTVTLSLALSIVTLLVACWAILQILLGVPHSYHYSHYYRGYDYDENFSETEEQWGLYLRSMELCMEFIYLFYSVVAAIIFIVMSALAGAALRSSKSQAIVVMTTTATDAPVE